METILNDNLLKTRGRTTIVLRLRAAMRPATIGDSPRRKDRFLPGNQTWPARLESHWSTAFTTSVRGSKFMGNR